MKVKAPFQGDYEHAGQGCDGWRYFENVRWVLRAFNPSRYRLYRWKTVWMGAIERRY